MENVEFNKKVGLAIGKEVMFLTVLEDIDYVLKAIITVYDKDDQFGKNIVIKYEDLKKMMGEE